MMNMCAVSGLSKATFFLTAFFASVANSYAFATETESTKREVEEKEPLIVFVHGRGQSQDKLEDVRSKFFQGFAAGQKLHFGEQIVPTDDLRFLWYADVIDENVESPHLGDGCKYAEQPNMTTKLKTKIRVGLVNAARKFGLDDFGLKVLARDTYKYLTDLAIRCEADARLSRLLYSDEMQDRAVIIVAHSMGGIITFSSLQKVDQSGSSTASVENLVTVGTQIGLDPVVRGLNGYLVEPPIPIPLMVKNWTNFLNTGDTLAFETEGKFIATDAAREPTDSYINVPGGRHNIETYLASKEVVETIVESWCEIANKHRDQCNKVINPRHSSASSLEDYLRTQQLDKLSSFFNISAPNLRLTEDSASKISARGDIVYLGVSRIIELAQEKDPEVIKNLATFVLAHELTHLAVKSYEHSEIKATSTSIRALECHADLWAGVALAESIASEKVEPAMDKMVTVVGFAAELGEQHQPGSKWYGNKNTHPSVEERALCAASGISAGLHLWSLKKSQLGDFRGTAGYYKNLHSDPNLFRTEDELQKWAADRAEEITSGGMLVSSGDPQDAPTIFLKLVNTNPISMEQVSKRAHDLKEVSICTVDVSRDIPRVAILCPRIKSATLDRETYEGFIKLTQPKMRLAGWHFTEYVDGERKLAQYTKENISAKVFPTKNGQGLTVEIHGDR